MSILVRHAMTPCPTWASPDTTALAAARTMRALDVGALPIVEGGEVVGVVTDRDLVLRVMAESRDPDATTVGDVSTPAAITVSPDMRLSEARDLMAELQIRRLPVMKGTDLVGMLSLGDVALADASERAVGHALGQVSESESTIANGAASHPRQPVRGRPSRVRVRPRTE
jgi:signal-transduction protein with cAMP-binding, CBS, and nucleotidyltransferase domain